ncbi:hypothetical protein Y032_0009g587 [Ancylostoma ceylanicum]|uniref:Uncharacterized protein n=2 Tax=Ancylostoma ceylanicum TaxID=53326 RepID=A0A016VHY1_9BILA|nr:hypothetical protein Y032_0009g587 [Ancylostoma ceylanicum]
MCTSGQRMYIFYFKWVYSAEVNGFVTRVQHRYPQKLLHRELNAANGTELRRFSLCLLTRSSAIHGQMQSMKEMEQGERNGGN